MSEITVVDIEALGAAADTAYEAAVSQIQELSEVSVTLLERSLVALRKVTAICRNPDAALDPSVFGLESVSADIATVQLGLGHAITHIAHMQKLVADASLAVNAASYSYGADNGETEDNESGAEGEDEDPDPDARN